MYMYLMTARFSLPETEEKNHATKKALALEVRHLLAQLPTWKERLRTGAIFSILHTDETGRKIKSLQPVITNWPQKEMFGQLLKNFWLIHSL